jgi:hypothetical protein
MVIEPTLFGELLSSFVSLLETHDKLLDVLIQLTS